MHIQGIATICIPSNQQFAIGYISTEKDIFRLLFTESFRPKIHECVQTPSRFWNCVVKTQNGSVIGEIDDIQQPRSDGDVFELSTEWDGDVLGTRTGNSLLFSVESIQVGPDAEKIVDRMFKKMARFDNVIVNGELSISIDDFEQ